MDDDNQNTQWKSIQRTWKDVISRISRTCRIPRQLLLFALIVGGIVFYTLLNNKVLRISDELLDLQGKVDIKESFESRSIDTHILSASNNATSAQEGMSDHKESLWKESAKSEEEENSKKAQRAHLRKEKLASRMESFVDVPVGNRSITIDGTLAQILPTSLGDDERDPFFLASYRLKYSAFVIPPPFTVETNHRNTLPIISRFYQELSSHKREDCVDEDICVHPSKYMRLYANWECNDSCKQDNDYIVFFQKEYTTGEIDVINDGVLPLSYECTCYSSHKLSLDASSVRPFKAPGTVVFLLVPQGATFYHFMDAVLPKLIQLESFLRDPSLRFLVDLSPQFPIVEQLLDRLGISAHRRIDYRSIKSAYDAIAAQRLVLSCHTPPLHPYLFQRAQYLLRLPHVMEPQKYRSNTIIYLSRRKGSLSGGRRVINEGELEKHLRRFAGNNGYEYVTFFHTDYKKLDDLLELFSRAVAIVGPHGGAFTNMMFAPKGTLVVEFIPNGAIFTGPTFKEHLAPYQQAMVMGHKYYAVMSQFSRRDDITVNIREVLEIMSKIHA